MVSIRARFDGSVFVPDEPVELPAQAVVRLLVETESQVDRPLLDLVKALEGLPEDHNAPADGAAEVDHYLYGHPRRGS